MPFYRATNTGVGFVTHEDREQFEVQNIVNDVYEVSGDYAAWVLRVGGQSVTAEQAAKEQRIAEIQGQLMRVDNPTLMVPVIGEVALTTEQIAALRAELALLVG